MDVVCVSKEKALGVESLVVLDTDASRVVEDLIRADVEQIWGGVEQPALVVEVGSGCWDPTNNDEGGRRQQVGALPGPAALQRKVEPRLDHRQRRRMENGAWARAPPRPTATGAEAKEEIGDNRNRTGARKGEGEAKRHWTTKGYWKGRGLRGRGGRGGTRLLTRCSRRQTPRRGRRRVMLRSDRRGRGPSLWEQRLPCGTGGTRSPRQRWHPPPPVTRAGRQGEGKVRGSSGREADGEKSHPMVWRTAAVPVTVSQVGGEKRR